MARITIRLPDTLYIQLVRYAKTRNRTQPAFSAIVREALETFFSTKDTPRLTKVRQTKKEEQDGHEASAPHERAL